MHLISAWMTLRIGHLAVFAVFIDVDRMNLLGDQHGIHILDYWYAAVWTWVALLISRKGWKIHKKAPDPHWYRKDKPNWHGAYRFGRFFSCCPSILWADVVLLLPDGCLRGWVLTSATRVGSWCQPALCAGVSHGKPLPFLPSPFFWLSPCIAHPRHIIECCSRMLETRTVLEVSLYFSMHATLSRFGFTWSHAKSHRRLPFAVAKQTLLSLAAFSCRCSKKDPATFREAKSHSDVQTRYKRVTMWAMKNPGCLWYIGECWLQ